MQNGNIQVLQNGIAQDYVLTDNDIGKITDVTMTIMSKISDLTTKYECCLINQLYAHDDLCFGQIMKPNGEFIDIPKSVKISVLFDFSKYNN